MGQGSSEGGEGDSLAERRARLRAARQGGVDSTPAVSGEKPSLVRSMMRRINASAAPEATAGAPRAEASRPIANPPQRRRSPAPRPPAGRIVAQTRPFAGFEWLIAGRYLRARRKEGMISVIAGFSLVGIALGVATLIIVMAVMTGFREELINRILGVRGHIYVQATEPQFPQYDEVAAKLRGVTGVTGVVPIVEGQLMASSQHGNAGVLVRGIRQADLLNMPAVAQPEFSLGSLSDFTGDNGIAIGAGLASALRVTPGDKITLIAPRGASTPFGVAPRIKAYTVLYVFRIGMSEIDKAFVYMPLQEAQLFFNKGQSVDLLEVTVDNPTQVASYDLPLRQAAGMTIVVSDWMRLNAGFISALKVEANVMFLILTLIILVAALNIISGLIMLVKDKARDVAILRTMGMTRGAVMRVFFICGASIGVIGTLAGLIIGVLFCQNIQAIQHFITEISGANVWDPEIRFLTEIPAKMQTHDVLAAVGLALALSFLSTLYPAWRAARLDPVEALRYE